MIFFVRTSYLQGLEFKLSCTRQNCESNLVTGILSPIISSCCHPALTQINYDLLEKSTDIQFLYQNLENLVFAYNLSAQFQNSYSKSF